MGDKMLFVVALIMMIYMRVMYWEIMGVLNDVKDALIRIVHYLKERDERNE